MKNRNKLYALLLTVVLVFGMVTSAFATENEGDTPTTEGTSSTVTLTKHLELPEGIKAVPDLTFQFTAEPKENGAGKITITDAVYSSEDELGELKYGKYTVDKQCSFAYEAFPHAGTFEYTLTENANTNDLGTTGGSVTYSDKKYPLFVLVANGEGGQLQVTGVYAKDNDGNKLTNLEFTNTYSKDTSLTIEKQVKGDYANQTKDFSFKITFHNLGLATTGSVTGKIGLEDVVCTVGTPQEFQLHHGEKLVFSSLPIGTRYTVEETASSGYTATVTVVENGTTTATDGTAQGKENGLAGEGENKVTFTNTHNDTPLTGIIMNNLPFLLLIAAGICALGVLAVSKKRRTAKRQ